MLIPSVLLFVWGFLKTISHSNVYFSKKSKGARETKHIFLHISIMRHSIFETLNIFVQYFEVTTSTILKIIFFN